MWKRWYNIKLTCILEVSDEKVPDCSLRPPDPAALNASGWDTRISTPLTVTTLAGQSFTVDPLKSGLVMSAEDAADWIYSYGREGNFFENFFSWLKCRARPTELVLPQKNVDYDYLNSLIAQNEADVTAALGEAEYVPDYENSVLVMKKGWGQLHLDQKALQAAIIRRPL